MIEINKFKNRMATLLRQAYNADPKNRAIWGIACNVHCYSDFGSVDTSPVAKNFTVPENTVYSLGFTSHRFIFENTSGLYLDEVDWPNNHPCSHTTYNVTVKPCNNEVYNSFKNGLFAE